MVKFVILLGLVLFSEIHGIPITGQSPDDLSITAGPRASDEGWITFPSWPFTVMPSVSSLFTDNQPIDNSMKLMKRRIDNLEKSQKSIYELLKRINPGEVSTACNNNKSPQHEKPILPSKTGEINKKMSPIKPTIDLISQVSTAIDEMPTDVDSTIPLTDSQSEMTIPVTRKIPITTATSDNEDNREIVNITGIEIPGNDNQTSSVFTTEIIKIEALKNPTDVPNLLGAIIGRASPESARVNTKFIWSPAMLKEDI